MLNRKKFDGDDPKEKKLMEHHSKDFPYPFKHLQDPGIPHNPEADRQEYFMSQCHQNCSGERRGK